MSANDQTANLCHACAERPFYANARDAGDSGYVERFFTNGAPYKPAQMNQYGCIQNNYKVCGSVRAEKEKQ